MNLPDDRWRVADRLFSTTARLHLALAGRLDAITLKALMKNPADRHGTVGRLIADIEEHLESSSGRSW